jgi:transposase
LIPLTVPELLRLLRLHDAPPDRQAAGHRWSVWRRAHQATARRGHSARRAQLHPPPRRHPAPISRVPGVPSLDERLTARLLAILPPAALVGRPATDPSQILGGILWVMRTGAPWREVPLGFGPWRTVYGRYRLWQQTGTWNRIAAVLTTTDPGLRTDS